MKYLAIIVFALVSKGAFGEVDEIKYCKNLGPTLADVIKCIQNVIEGNPDFQEFRTKLSFLFVGSRAKVKLIDKFPVSGECWVRPEDRELADKHPLSQKFVCILQGKGTEKVRPDRTVKITLLHPEHLINMDKVGSLFLDTVKGVKTTSEEIEQNEKNSALMGTEIDSKIPEIEIKLEEELRAKFPVEFGFQKKTRDGGILTLIIGTNLNKSSMIRLRLESEENGGTTFTYAYGRVENSVFLPHSEDYTQTIQREVGLIFDGYQANKLSSLISLRIIKDRLLLFYSSANCITETRELDPSYTIGFSLIAGVQTGCSLSGTQLTLLKIDNWEIPLLHLRIKSDTVGLSLEFLIGDAEAKEVENKIVEAFQTFQTDVKTLLEETELSEEMKSKNLNKKLKKLYIEMEGTFPFFRVSSSSKEKNSKKDQKSAEKDKKINDVLTLQTFNLNTYQMSGMKLIIPEEGVEKRFAFLRKQILDWKKTKQIM